MNWLLIAALLAGPRVHSGPAPTIPTLTDDELRDKIHAYLGAIDTPIPEDHWRALGPRAAAVLEPIVTDTNAMPSRRAKAIDGLVAAAPDKAARLVGKLARDDAQPTVVRVAALHGAAKVFSSSRLVTEVKPVMQRAPEAGLRGEAAEVLSRAKGGCEAVRAHAAREKDEDRVAYRRALARCGE
jgi:hypothetical protein